MENLIYIDNYFTGKKTEAAIHYFEKRIVNDAAFAEEVAFYLSANTAIRQQAEAEKKERFRQIYQQQKVVPLNNNKPVKKMWRLAAAASVAALVALAAWWMIGKNETPQQYAQQYIEKNMQRLVVTMGSKQDSMQVAIDLFNEGKLQQALAQFETIIKNDAGNSNAKKYAGIASIRLEKYDTALQYFRALATDTLLYSNPGKLYEAITLLQRNKEGDTALAKQLLQHIIDDNLYGKEEAILILKK